MSHAVAPWLVDRLCDAYERLGAPWQRSMLAEAFATVIEPGRAELLAQRVVDLMPTEPIEPVATLRLLLVELPKLPAVVVPLELPAARMRFDVPAIADLAALAQLVNLTPAELDWFADHGGWLRRAAKPLSHYRYRQLPKANGVRLVEAPKARLREIQRTILHRILDRVPAHRACHGFEKHRNAATFAAPHAQSITVARLDLRDFFAHVGIGRVRGIFAAIGYAEPVARALADLCTTASPVAELRGLDFHQASLLRARHLPQGAPTSPRLANLAALGLDRRIAGFAQRNMLTYTRYADDLALSGSLDAELVEWTVATIARDEGFAVNRAKTLVRRSHQRQILAGLVVNERPAVPRERYDNLRALLHNCIATGPAAQNRDGHNDFRAHVYGLIAWVGETSPARRRRLLELADRIEWSH